MDASVYVAIGTALVGAAGWFFAWRARGEVDDVRQQLAAAESATVAAGVKTTAAEARAVTAETQLTAAYQARALAEAALDSERKSKETLLNALVKSGAPVGAPVVDTTLDRLYEDGGGSGTPSGAGGDQAGVSGGAAPASAQTVSRK